MATVLSPTGDTASHKITKPRSKMVKPILKKLSHSEKNSLDLDRGWDEQGGPGVYYESAASAGRSARDVSFSFADGFPTTAAVASSSSAAAAGSSKARFTHVRSPSGASVATSGSGGPRAGTFVHPFQQTPRTSTPPLSYANSFDNGPSRDYSPTITENEDDDDYTSLPPHIYHHHHSSHSVSQSNLRRPSLASQRTASFTDITTAGGALPPQLRVVTTSRSAQSSSRLAHHGGSLTSSLSHSDLHLHLTLDSPSATCPPTTIPPPIASPNSSLGPMSPLRSSLEGVGFPRLRSRSELDAGARAEHIREARRKFEARERAKEEKHDREMMRKRERRDHKEAKEMERMAAAQVRKNSTGTVSDLVVRPTVSRKSTPTGSGNVKASSGGGGGSAAAAAVAAAAAADTGGSGRLPTHELGEKQALDFMSSNYESMPAGGTTPSFGPGVDDVRFQPAPPRRTLTAKKKTQGYWTGFILWVRTRLFRLGRK